MSNSSSSSEDTVAKLPKLGFDHNSFVGAVTSGEEASHHISDVYGSESAKKALFITWKTPKVPSPVSFLKKCGKVEVASSIDDADFVICHGADVVRGPGADGEAKETSLGSFFVDGSFEKIDPLLQKCCQRNLPMVCCNPDFVMVKPDGTKGHMPGK